MLSNFKLFTGITLSLLLSGITLAPVKAESMDKQTEMKDRQMMDNQTEKKDDGQVDTSEKMRGRVVSIVGSIITVELEDGKTKAMSTGTNIQTWQLQEGMNVYVVDDVIVGMAPPVGVEETQTDNDFNSRTSELIQQLNREESTTVTPRPQTTTQTTQTEYQQESTYEAPQEEPVRALW